MTDYKYKYKKYLHKYKKILKQHKMLGGATVPNVIPATQSWFFMPIILLPFDELLIDFNDLNKIIINGFVRYGLNSIDAITAFIRDRIRLLIPDINFNDRRDLGRNVEPLNLHYDDAPNFMHLSHDSQERLLDRIILHDDILDIDISLREVLSALAIDIIQDFSGRYFDFVSLDNIE